MRFGTCIGGDDPSKISATERLGYDYFETNFGFLSKISDGDFEKFKTCVLSGGIRCEAANCFMPNELPVTGEEVNYAAIAEYVEKGMKRGVEVGLKTVVFGSGGARRVPEGFSYAKGFKQLGCFLGEVVSPIAEKYGITVVIEPLRAKECNIINSVKEGVMLSAFTGRDNIQTLADIYHMLFANDTYDDIRMLKGSIYHAHISNPFSETEKRVYMKKGDTFDYKGFIEALEYAGCVRCSIEAATSDYINDAADAMEVIKTLK